MLEKIVVEARSAPVGFSVEKDFLCPAGHVRGVEGNFVYVFTVAGFTYVLTTRNWRCCRHVQYLPI